MTSAATDALVRTAARYRTGRRFARHYVAAKLRTDPIHRALLERADAMPFGEVVDAGCGKAQIALALLEAGAASRVHGLDWSAASLGDATAAASGLAFTAEPRDLAAEPALPPCDTVLLIDVLYTLGRPAAFRLLEAAMVAARRHVVLRALDAEAGWRGRFAVALEHLGRRIWPHAGAHVAPLRVGELRAALQAGGFDTEAAPCWGRTPFANVLVVGTRRAPSKSTGCA